MVRKTKKRRDERLIRTVTISSVRTSVSTYASHPRGSGPEIETNCYLDLVGILDETVRDVVDIEVHVYPKDDQRIGTARPTPVGAIIDFHPHMQLVVSLLHRDFDRLWTMALTGYLKYARLVFTPPHRRTSLVTSVSFSTTREE